MKVDFVKATTKRYKIGLNPSYIDSVRIALVDGLWNAPTSLVRVLLGNLIPLLLVVLAIPFNLMVWVLVHITILLLGFAGMLQSTLSDDEKTP